MSGAEASRAADGVLFESEERQRAVIMWERVAGVAGCESAGWEWTGVLEETKKEAEPGRSVILLTANDTDMDIVAGLEMGADDYITKPFSLAVLRARVNTQLRKNGNSAGVGKTFQQDSFVFDFDRMKFTKK